MNIKTKKPVSVFLSLLMLLSVFGGMAFTAKADPGPAAVYTKDSEGIADGVILENPGDTIDTANTSKNLIFDYIIPVDYENNNADVWNSYYGQLWVNVESFYINDNNEFICYNYFFASRFIPDEGKTFMVRYDAADDLWYITEADPAALHPCTGGLCREKRLLENVRH